MKLKNFFLHVTKETVLEVKMKLSLPLTRLPCHEDILCLLKHHPMKMCSGVVGFMPWPLYPPYPLVGGWVDPIASLDAVEKNSLLLLRIEHVIQPIA